MNKQRNIYYDLNLKIRLLGTVNSTIILFAIQSILQDKIKRLINTWKINFTNDLSFCLSAPKSAQCECHNRFSLLTLSLANNIMSNFVVGKIKIKESQSDVRNKSRSGEEGNNPTLP